MTKKRYFITLLFTGVLLFPAIGWPRPPKPLAPNYPLRLINYIYGNNSNGLRDTPEKGGTIVSCAQNSKGLLYLLYTGNRSEIQVFDQRGEFIFRFGEEGEKDGQFSGYTCTLDINSKDEVLVTDVKKRKIWIFDQEGRYLNAFSSIKGLSSKDPKQDTYPAHMAIGPGDRIYISDGRNGHVWIHNSKGMFLKHLGGPRPGLFPSAGHVRFDRQGSIYILEGIPNRIQVCTPEGNPLIQIGESGNRAGQFLRISGLAIDGEDRVYATDIVQNVIQVFNNKGDLIGVVKEYMTSEGESRNFLAPSGILIGKGDIIYVTEQSNHRLVVLEPPQKSDKGVVTD
ncbi:MAG: NHL repeat-containing protein [bacterium]